MERIPAQGKGPAAKPDAEVVRRVVQKVFGDGDNNRCKNPTAVRQCKTSTAPADVKEEGGCAVQLAVTRLNRFEQEIAALAQFHAHASGFRGKITG